MALPELLYAAAARLRRRWYDARPERRRALRRPVISVGNLAVGGSGKTPLVALIARLLAEAGHRPVVLSRGYGRPHPDDGVTVVSDGRVIRADLGRAGDEPLMLARGLPGVPVLVSPDRYLAGVLAESAFDATVHVLDDGFQHFALARQVDLIVVDAEDVRQPRTLPGGRLREPIDAARHADAVLVSGGDPAALATELGVAAGFALVREAEAAVEETPDGPVPLSAGARVLVVSGIARPERFEAEARAGGYDVAGVMAFRDHHLYDSRDVARIGAEATRHGAAAVLVTEKDLVRLLAWRPWPFRLAVRPMTVRVEPGPAFQQWLTDRVAAAPGAPPEAAA